MVIRTTNNSPSQMSMFPRGFFLIVSIISLSVQCYGQRYSNYFTENQPPIDWELIKDSVSPALPEYFLSNPKPSDPNYKAEVVSWIYSDPNGFDKAKMMDGRLHEYVHWAMKVEGKSRDEGPFGNPPFVYYPVNENRPVFIDTKNPDQDSLIFRHKTQNWYFNFHMEEYKELYGKLPEILPYPAPINHPDDFPADYGRSNIDWYYPEFSKDSRVMAEYKALYNSQFGSATIEEQK
jgi:hypothetical protein